MRVKDKAQLVLGIIDVLLSITISILAIVQHKEDKLIVAVFVLLCGIMALSNGIETKKQHEKQEEIYEQIIAFLHGEEDKKE